MTILALDPSRHTGAAWEQNGAIAYATWDLGDNQRLRLLNLVDHISAIANASTHGISILGYETPWAGPNFTAVRALCHYEAMILAWSQRAGVMCYGYTPREIKASIRIGPGRKEGVIRGVKLCGFDPKDDNQADALAILLMMMKNVLPSKEVKTFRKQTNKKVPTLFSRR
jgi:Holliday junction resolvasome RuvABC endonuclease subunit